MRTTQLRGLARRSAKLAGGIKAMILKSGPGGATWCPLPAVSLNIGKRTQWWSARGTCCRSSEQRGCFESVNVTEPESDKHIVLPADQSSRCTLNRFPNSSPSKSATPSRPSATSSARSMSSTSSTSSSPPSASGSDPPARTRGWMRDAEVWVHSPGFSRSALKGARTLSSAVWKGRAAGPSAAVWAAR